MKSQLIQAHYWDLWKVCLLLLIYQAPWSYYQKVSLVSLVSDLMNNVFWMHIQSRMDQHITVSVCPLFLNWLKHIRILILYVNQAQIWGDTGFYSTAQPTHTHSWVRSSLSCFLVPTCYYYHPLCSWVTVKGDQANWSDWLVKLLFYFLIYFLHCLVICCSFTPDMSVKSVLECLCIRQSKASLCV